jgi:hypothetical protein
MKNIVKLSILLIIILFAGNTYSQETTQWGPDGYVKIEEGSGGFEAELEPGDRFSRDHDAIGDVNGDGIIDMVVGARSDDDGATDAGAVYILFMNSDGTVNSNQKISMLEGEFYDTLNPGNFFGYGVAGIGDYDQDGIPDIAVSSPVPPNRSIYIIFLNSNGTVKSYFKNQNITAQGLTAVGDLNLDGRIDLVACDPGSDIGGADIGAIRVLFFTPNGQLMPAQTVLISPQNQIFSNNIHPGDQFGGREVAMLGDMDNDGTLEMAVGSFMANGGKGAIWILSLDPIQLTVEQATKITEGLNGFTDTLTTGINPNGTEGANFGHAMCRAGDLNGDGVVDLITGANQQGEGWGYILYMNSNKTVKTFTRINNLHGGFGLVLDAIERFSRSISFLGDLRNDGTIAVNFGGGAGGTGTLYLLFFKPCEFTQLTMGYNYTNTQFLFSNVDINGQVQAGDSLSFEQCTFEAFTNGANYINYNEITGACQCLDGNSTVNSTVGLGTGFSNGCFAGAWVNNLADESGQMSLFPNPALSSVQLVFKDEIFIQDISLFTINGQKLSSLEFNPNSREINIISLAPGFYFIEVNKEFRMPFIKN